MRSKAKLFLLVSLLVSSLFFISSASAKECKEMAKSACAGSDTCSWVKAFTRKDNVKVKAHCRKKSKSKSASKKKEKAKGSSTKKSKKKKKTSSSSS